MKKILIAEDDKFLANAYRLKLSKFGYEVILTYDGEETLKCFEKDTPDLIVLDLIMPKTDGFEVLAEIRKKNTSVPVIVVTNLGQAEDYKKVKELGVSDYAVKTDITLDQLVDKIDEVLAKK